MAIKLDILNGIDWVDGDVLFAADLVGTTQEMIETAGAAIVEIYGEYAVKTGCEITEQTSPDLSVKMDAGTFFINGIRYTASADGIIAMTAADLVDPRYDLISISKDGTITVTDGTPAIAPVIPALPTDNVPLAYVYRIVGDDIINTVDITDCRKLTLNNLVYKDVTKYNKEASGYATIIDYTVPAFKCNKSLEIDRNLIFYYDYIFEKFNTETPFYSKLLINDVEVDLFTLKMKYTTIRYNTLSTGSNQDSAFVQTGNNAKVILTEEDGIDFTQPINIKIQLQAVSANSGSKLTISSDLFLLRGK